MVISGGTWDTNFWGKYFFAHELHGWTRRLCATGMATGSVARIVTNAMRVLLPLRKILPLKTIHTRHWRGLLADLQRVICYGLG